MIMVWGARERERERERDIDIERNKRSRERDREIERESERDMERERDRTGWHAHQDYCDQNDVALVRYYKKQKAIRDKAARDKA
jgi:hypothetical protein